MTTLYKLETLLEVWGLLYNGSMPTPVLVTKLYIPIPPRHAVRHSRLLTQLNEGMHRKLTLISAPAGFGKTTLLSTWVAGCNRQAAWLSLDAGDSDQARFLTYLIAALRTHRRPDAVR